MFLNLELILHHYRERHVFILGDMDTCMGTPNNKELYYKRNQYPVTNLLKILETHDSMFIVNGFTYSNLLPKPHSLILTRKTPLTLSASTFSHL